MIAVRDGGFVNVRKAVNEGLNSTVGVAVGD